MSERVVFGVPRRLLGMIHLVRRRRAHRPDMRRVVLVEICLHRNEGDEDTEESDTEKADLARERRELSDDPRAEHDELAEIYVKRGIDRETAQQVARQLMARDPLAAHARDELGISEITTARPVQASLTSAVMFSVGAAMPLLMVVVAPANLLVPIVSAASLCFLALLGAVGARAGGADILRATLRVTFWGALALGVTAGIGKLFGTVV